MRTRYVLLIVAAFLISGLASGASSRLFKGSNSHINQIIQDHAGYIWLATDNGLTRYDGYNVKTYTRTAESPSLLNNIVLSVMEDADNNLWVGTNDGIQKFNRITETFETPRLNYPGIPEFTYVNSIIEDSKKNIWFTTSRSGLICFPPNDAEPKWYLTTNSAIASNKTTVVFEDKFGNIWIGTNDSGVTVFNPSNNSMMTYSHNPDDPNSLSGNMIRSIAQTNDGQLYIASLDGGIDSYNYRTNKFTRNAIPIDGKTFVLRNDPASNTLFIGTDGNGAYSFSPGAQEGMRVKKLTPDVKEFDITHAKIHDIIIDRKGNLWAAAYQQGALLVPSLSEDIVNYGFNPFNKSLDIGNYPVLSMMRDHEGNLWIASDGDGIYRMNRDGSVKHFSGNDLKSDIVLTVFQSASGTVWAGSYFGGLSRYNAGSDSFTHIPIADDRRQLSDINTIAEDSSGRLWIGTNGNGICIYNPADGTYEFLKHNSEAAPESQIAGNSVHWIIFDRKGKVWIGTSDAGISVYDPATKRFEQYNIMNRRLNNNSIYSMVEDPNGNIWVATAAGLVRISDGKTFYFNERAGIPESPILGMVLDNDGNIWFSNTEGLSKFNIKNNKILSKLPTSRLGNLEFKRGAAYIDSEGRIYFGGVGGVSSFFPTSFENQSSLSNVEFLEISYQQRQDDGSEKIVTLPIASGYDIKLGYDSNTFTVSFGGMEYAHPEDVVYSVMLENYRDSWVEVAPGTQSVTFSKVPPGKYLLHVRAQLGESVVENTLTIIIKPPFYLTWWAKCIYGLLLIALVLGGLYYYREYNRRKLERMKMRSEEKNTEDKLRFFTDISHEVRTPLTLILAPIQSLKKNTSDKKVLAQYEIMENNGERILRLIDQIMDLRKIDNKKMQLQVMPTDIRMFIDRIGRSFDYIIKSHKIDYGVSFTDEVPAEVMLDRDKIDKVVFNVIGNALRLTPEGGKVRVEVDIDGNGDLRIRISDTGPGIAPENTEVIFERFFREKTAKNSGGTGIGLHLSRMMMDSHHGRIFVEETSSAGTTFAIIIPLASYSYKQEEIVGEAEPLNELKEVRSADNDLTNSRIPSVARKSHTVLLVEDDKSILNYLTKSLSSDYNVMQAANGEEALSAVVRHRPHCVITDIMMEGMDGLELCRKIRSNPQVCEIPLIMLTAKASPEQQIEGIEAGADSYIVKPFNMDHLKAQLSRLIHARRIITAKLTNSEKINENVAKIKPEDAKFMEKLETVVVNELANPELNVEFIASEIGVSRSHLHRRLREIANISPSTFIKQARMRHAAILLTEKRLSVSETAYATGFNSLSHFSTVFKEYFGMTPTNFVALNINGDISETNDDKS